MPALSPDQIAGLVCAQQALLSPHDHATPEAWMTAAGAAVKGAVGAEQATFLVSLPTGLVVTTDASPATTEAYFAHYAAVDTAPVMLERHVRPYAVEADFEGMPAFERFTQSEAHADWYRPNGLDRTASLRAYASAPVAAPFGPTWKRTLMANILLGGAAGARGPDAEAARTALALLQPSLEAGARTLRAALGAWAALSRALDAVAAPLWLFDEAGRCVHASPEAGGLQRRLGAGQALGEAAGRLARTLLDARRWGRPAPGPWRGRVGGERLGLVATLLPAAQPSAPAVLVRAEGLAALLPDAGALRARFGLSPQEARVALLRAGGAATEAVAERLGISVHTARRHTENVMFKLDVRRVAEIGPALLTPPDEG